MQKLLPLIFLFALVLTGCQEQPAPEVMPVEEPLEAVDSAPDSLLRHAVFFSFKESSSAEEVETVRKAFSALSGKIDVIHDYEWGTNNSPEGLNKGFTHAFFVTFLSEADREVYLPHPDHQAFVEVLKPHLEDVFVVDYWARTD